MMSTVECRSWDRDNHRARKVATRRRRGLKRKRQSPRQQLSKDHYRSRVVGSWIISQESSPSSILEGLRTACTNAVSSRRSIVEERKRAALRSLSSVQQFSLIRLNKRGAVIRWKDCRDQDFEITIREQDCREIFALNRSLDDWQWILNLNRDKQHLVVDIITIYQSMARHQIRELLKHGETLYDSPRVGLRNITIKDGQLESTAVLVEMPAPPLADFTQAA